MALGLVLMLIVSPVCKPLPVSRQCAPIFKPWRDLDQSAIGTAAQVVIHSVHKPLGSVWGALLSRLWSTYPIFCWTYSLAQTLMHTMKVPGWNSRRGRLHRSPKVSAMSELSSLSCSFGWDSTTAFQTDSIGVAEGEILFFYVHRRKPRCPTPTGLAAVTDCTFPTTRFDALLVSKAKEI